MLEALKKEASQLPEGEAKTKLLTEIEKLEKANLISRPTSLADFLNAEESADLKNQQASILSAYRVKWEKELAEKKQKEEDEKTPKTNDEKFAEIISGVTKTLKELSEKVSTIETGKKISSLSDYAKEKAKDLPKEFSSLIQVGETTTEADIDKQIELLTTAHQNVLKSIDNTPGGGKTKTPEGNLNEWKEALPIKEKKND